MRWSWIHKQSAERYTANPKRYTDNWISPAALLENIISKKNKRCIYLSLLDCLYGKVWEFGNRHMPCILKYFTKCSTAACFSFLFKGTLINSHIRSTQTYCSNLKLSRVFSITFAPIFHLFQHTHTCNCLDIIYAWSAWQNQNLNIKILATQMPLVKITVGLSGCRRAVMWLLIRSALKSAFHFDGMWA